MGILISPLTESHIIDRNNIRDLLNNNLMKKIIIIIFALSWIFSCKNGESNNNKPFHPRLKCFIYKRGSTPDYCVEVDKNGVMKMSKGGLPELFIRLVMLGYNVEEDYLRPCMHIQEEKNKRLGKEECVKLNGLIKKFLASNCSKWHSTSCGEDLIEHVLMKPELLQDKKEYELLFRWYCLLIIDGEQWLLPINYSQDEFQELIQTVSGDFWLLLSYIKVCQVI